MKKSIYQIINIHIQMILMYIVLLYWHTWKNISNTLFNPIKENRGDEYIGSYISILRNEWIDRFLWLDAEDQFEGGLEGHLSNGNIMNAFYNTKMLDGMKIGNHDFDLGYDQLVEKWKYLIMIIWLLICMIQILNHMSLCINKK